MKAFIKKNTWLPADFAGWGNGYIVIPQDHPLYCLDYDSIDVDVHGGLTYAALVTREMLHSGWAQLDEGDLDCWMIGFDTAHYNDNATTWPMERVQQELDSLLRQVELIEVAEKPIVYDKYAEED